MLNLSSITRAALGLRNGGDAPRQITRELEVGGEQRKATFSLPDPKKFPVPKGIVIDGHGILANGKLQDGTTHMSVEATERGHIVITPEGTPLALGMGQRWDGMEKELVGNFDDESFLRALLKETNSVVREQTGRKFDSKKSPVLLEGFSNFAFNVLHQTALAKDYKLVLAAVSGLAPESFRIARDVPAIPTMIFMGRNDPIVPLNGRQLAPFTTPMEGTYATARKFAEHNGVPRKPKELWTTTLDQSVEEARAPSGPGTVHVSLYGDSPAKQVVVVTDDYGHAWPGGETLPGPILRPLQWLGDRVGLRTTDNYSATTLMLDFFERAAEAMK